MSVVESSLVAPAPSGTAFDVSQSTGDVRLRWDPLVPPAFGRRATLRPGMREPSGP
jgi:hypothetical protein